MNRIKWYKNLYLSVFTATFSVVLLLRCSSSSTQNQLVQETCTRCARADPKNINLNFCVASLQESSSPAAAAESRNLRHLGIASINHLPRNLTNTKSYIQHLLLKNTTMISLDPFIRACLQDCLELYSGAVPAARKALRDFKANRFDDTNAGISSVVDASTTCEEGFKEKKGIVSPLTRRNNDTFHLSALSLCITNMFTTAKPLVPIGLD